MGRKDDSQPPPGWSRTRQTLGYCRHFGCQARLIPLGVGADPRPGPPARVVSELKPQGSDGG